MEQERSCRYYWTYPVAWMRLGQAFLRDLRSPHAADHGDEAQKAVDEADPVLAVE